MAINKLLEVTDREGIDVSIGLREITDGVRLMAIHRITEEEVIIEISSEDAAVLGKWLQEVSE